MDRVSLIIDNIIFNKFLDYTFSKNLYEPESPFSFTVERLQNEIALGSKCQLKINGLLQYTGIVDKIEKSFDESGIRYNISGRSLAGLINDQYITKFDNLSGVAFKTIVSDLLKEIPIIKNLVDENKLQFGRKVTELIAVSENDEWKPNPSDTVFSFIKKLCNYHGLIFFFDAQNNMYFDKPIQSGTPEYFFIISKNNINDGFSNKSNILSGSFSNDISKLYGTIKIYGQSDSETDFNIKKTITDSTAPINKTIVYEYQQNTNIERMTRQITEQQRFDSKNIRYSVPNHSQNNKIFDINTFCSVQDDCLGIHGNYLIYGLTFNLNSNGLTTDIQISEKGMPI